MESNLEKLKDECKTFTKARLYRNLIFVKCLLFVGTLTGLWCIDVFVWLIMYTFFTFLEFFDFTLPLILFFVIAHFIYWEFIGKKNAKELLLSFKELNTPLMHQALKEVKAEKFGKNKKS